MAGDDGDGLWVFAYGSLMWRPGFPYEEAARARLMGYKRCFCVYSVHHRGTPCQPGLVLGLDRGGSCEGMAFRVAGSNADHVLAYLRAREQVTAVYREALAPISFADGGTAFAVAYVVERRHAAYAGALPLAVEARLIRSGKGRSGANIAYFASTVAHLRSLGIRERGLERLASAVGNVFVRPSSALAPLPRTKAARRCATKPPAFQRAGLSRFSYRLRVKRLGASS